MKVLPLMLAAALGSSQYAAASNPATNGNVAATSSVTVIVSSLASTQSVVKIYFYNLRESFLKPKQYAFYKVVRPGGQDRIVLPLDLPQGEWAVAITQDINNNDKLDKNMMGIPTEPYAFSNNVRPRLGPPDFDECKFTVGAASQTISIVLQK